MSRRSLRPQLNQIRGWVRQGRTDAWIAHQLEVTVQQIQAFKREQGLEADGDEPGATVEEVDLRAEDDAQIAAELEAEAERRAEEEAKAAEEAARKAAEDEARKAAEDEAGKAAEDEAGKAAEDEAGKGAEDEAEPAAGEDDAKAKRPRRRGGRTRRRTAVSRPLEGTFDHGEEGYGLWLDPAVQDDPIYAEHWAGHRPIEVTIEEDQIVIRRAGGGEDDDSED
jgi:membrane protein involved in colicin uptake